MTLVAGMEVMRSFWSDPYLWVHAAGVAVVPITLELCVLGLAMGDPFLPTGLELLLIGAVGILPVLWMQWQRPFYIFSLVLVALKPDRLSDQQRKLLRFFKTVEVRGLTVLTAIALAIVLWKLYYLAPNALEAAAFLPQSRVLGLSLAAIAFLASNLFLQVPVSVARVLLASEASMAAVEPFPVEQIPQAFSVLGLRVQQILPSTGGEAVLATAPAVPASPPISEPIPPTETAASEPTSVSLEAVAAAIADPVPVSEPTVVGAADSEAIASESDVAETVSTEDLTAEADSAASSETPASADSATEAAVLNPEFVATSPDSTAIADTPEASPASSESDPASDDSANADEMV